MKGTKWILLMVVVAFLMHKVVQSDSDVESDIDEREKEEAEIAKEVVERLAALSKADDKDNNYIQKKGLFRRRRRRRRRWFKRVVKVVGIGLKVAKVLGVVGKK